MVESRHHSFFGKWRIRTALVKVFNDHSANRASATSAEARVLAHGTSRNSQDGKQIWERVIETIEGQPCQVKSGAIVI
jgi:hypothetical protein